MIETSFRKRSVQDVLTSSGDLLAEIKGFQSQIPHSLSRTAFKAFDVLVPENFEWEDIIVNLFIPSEIPQSAPVGTTVIIHGHERSSPCFANMFCHVLGYQPRDGGTKAWKVKWHAIY